VSLLSRMRALAQPEYGCAFDAARVLLAAFVPRVFLESLDAAAMEPDGRVPPAALCGIELSCVLRVWPRLRELLIDGDEGGASVDVAARMDAFAAALLHANVAVTAIRVIVRPPKTLPVATRTELISAFPLMLQILASAAAKEDPGSAHGVSLYDAAHRIAKMTALSLAPEALLDFGRTLVESHIVPLHWDVGTIRGPLEVCPLAGAVLCPDVLDLTAAGSTTESAQANVRAARGFDAGKVRAAQIRRLIVTLSVPRCAGDVDG
jgi:hypothetical protein